MKLKYLDPCYVYDNGTLHLVGYMFLLNAPEQFKTDFESRFNRRLSGNQTENEVEQFETNWIKSHSERS